MRYTKKPVTIEAVRFMGLTDFGDPQFDVADGMPDWLMEALAGPEGDVGSIWVDRSSGNPLLAHGYSANLLGEMHALKDAIPAGDWIVRNEDGHIWICGPDIFEATYDALFGPKDAQAEIAPEFSQAIKDGERSLLLDMQSECIQLRVALAKARDQFAFYTKEHITKAEGFEHKARHAGERGDKMVQENRIEDAQSSRDKAGVNRTYAEMCQKAIDCRPATGSDDCPKLEAIHERGVDALAQSAFVIGEGFKTVGDSDGDDGA